MRQMELSGKRVLVFGAGRSGQGAASLLLAAGSQPVLYDGNKFTIKDNKDNVICEKEVKLTEVAFQTICSALEAVGKQLYIEGDNFVEDGENKEDMPF